MMWRPSAISRSAWRWTLETSGQVASTKLEPRCSADGGHRLRHAMRREHHRPVVGHFVQFVDEHRAKAAQPVDDELVVDDLVADIDRRPEPLDRQLDDLDGAVDAGAEAARGGDQDVKGWRGRGIGGDVSNCLPG